MSVPILVKINQESEMPTDGHTDKLTHWQTQTDFLICPMLYAMAMGQIKKLSKFLKNCTARWKTYPVISSKSSHL